MTAALPEGWAVAPIGSVARVVGGGTPPSHDPDNFAPVGHGIPWVTPADLSGYRSQSISRGARDLSEAGLARCGATLMPKGTVLFSSRAPIGYVAIAANEISTNQGFKSFVLPSEIDPRFVYWQLKHLKPEAEAIATGTTFKELSGAAAATLPLKIAPAPEQTRIADQLDTLLARIQACQDRLEAIPALLKRFRRSVLAAATSGELTREWREQRGLGIDGWTRSTVGQLIDGIEAGLNVQCEERPPADNERGLVKISAVTWGTYDDNESKTLPPSAAVPERSRIRIGDFLISRANTLELVGACVIVHRVTRPVFLSDKILRLVMPQDWKPWLLLLLQSPEGRRQIESRASGNQLSMRNLSQVNLREIGVPIPTPEERAEIVRRAKSLLAFADGLERRCGAGMSILGKLTRSVLAKAFRGELVPQDPKDEPASELLARIAAERSAPATPSRLRSPRAGRPPRVPKEFATMTKSRQDDDVMGQPYLAGHLRRIGAPASAEALFKVAELPVADFYKQLAWEVDQGHVKDNQTTLEPGHAAG